MRCTSIDFVADSLLTNDEMEQVYVLSAVTAADFTVSVPVWLLVLESYDPESATKLSPFSKPDHTIDNVAAIAVILHDMTVCVSTRTSLLMASTAEKSGTI